jgi:quinohemoprotein amine dehydrogenase
MYPLVDGQAFRDPPGPRPVSASADGRPPDTRQPMEKAVAHLSAAFPLVTPEWSAWVAAMAPPQLQGRWALAGYQVGKGAVFGHVAIAAKGTPDSGEFTTESTYTYARTGETVTRSGRAILYTGYQWRGSSGTPPPGAAGWATRGGDEWREVLAVDRDWRHASGRWFTGSYTEIGIDVRLERVGADPLVLGVEPARLDAGGSARELRIYGANLPTRVAPADVTLGPGITVDRVVSATPDQLVVTVSAARTATAGRRPVRLTAATGEASVAVYTSIDYVKVSPPAAMAYLGGGGSQFPKGFQQFEAVAYANGADGKPNTKDDIDLGWVDAAWALEEYTTTYNDNDREFVGTIDQAGFFTPNIDGPNPKRRVDNSPRGTNNWGDVWAVATVQPDGQARATPLRARAFLLVTIPTYMVWDQPEVGR